MELRCMNLWFGRLTIRARPSRLQMVLFALIAGVLVSAAQFRLDLWTPAFMHATRQLR